MGRLEKTLATLALALSMSAILAREQNDLPAAGRSTFDRVVGDGPVPFPFSKLLESIEQGLVREGLPPIKIVLIPLGRSLQRAAGAPDFFRYPRVVAAVDGQNKTGALPLKDRLFLGYHEKGAVLEVISYNDADGRFEFQVVPDYRPDGKPQVFYARRSLCLACHQNGAPIFARPLWDETPANPAIAKRLAAENRDFYGVPLAGTDIAYFVDASTDRANLFSVWQQIWRDGCGQESRGDDCRMQAFAAALRYALSGALPPPEALTADLMELDARWRGAWPQGLSIPNPDIPNRDPLAPVPAAGLVARIDSGPSSIGGGSSDELALLTHVPAQFEPLQLRVPLEIWNEPNKPRIIAGMAGLLDGAEVRALDRLLVKGSHAKERAILDCAVHSKDDGTRLRFECGGQGTLTGYLEIRGAGVGGTLERLRVGGAAAAPNLVLRGFRQDGGYRLEIKRDEQPARLSDGRMLEALELQADRAELILQDDFATVLTALEKLRGQGSFASRTFSDSSLRAVLAELGEIPNATAIRLPPPQADSAAYNHGSGIPARFRRHCGACHDTTLSHPPNFLHGDDGAVQLQLDHCAERIYYRLSMWSVPDAQRGKTPMPPLPALAAQGYQDQEWAASGDLAALRGHAESVLRRAGGVPDQLLIRPFEGLQPCLPAAAYAKGSDAGSQSAVAPR